MGGESIIFSMCFYVDSHCRGTSHKYIPTATGTAWEGGGAPRIRVVDTRAHCRGGHVANPRRARSRRIFSPRPRASAWTTKCSRDGGALRAWRMPRAAQRFFFTCRRDPLQGLSGCCLANTPASLAHWCCGLCPLPRSRCARCPVVERPPCSSSAPTAPAPLSPPFPPLLPSLPPPRPASPATRPPCPPHLPPPT